MKKITKLNGWLESKIGLDFGDLLFLSFIFIASIFLFGFMFLG